MYFSSFATVLSFFATIFISSANSSQLNNSLETQINDRKKDVKDERVIGGQDAKVGERPFQVVLLKNNRFICGGSLISPRAVVTAAHCVYGASGQVFKIRYNTLNCSSGPTIEVMKAIPHQYYSSNSMDYDIAVLILSSSVKADKNTNTISLSQSGDPEPSSSVTVSGWGKTSSNGYISEKLKVADLTVISRSVCSRNYVNVITRKMICASHPTRSACNGDSGGPLTQKDAKTGKIQLVGIVSFGSSSCLDINRPNVYTKVSSYYPWIMSTTTRYNAN